MQAIEVQTEDNFLLAARLYLTEQPIGSVILPTAMGVKQDYYAAFAQWLSKQGYVVATFDYRGMGDSRSGSLRGFVADFHSWVLDYEAVVDTLKARLPELPLYVVGHSLGAQLPGMLRNKHKIAGMISVASGSGYWRDNTPQLKRKMPYFWFVLVPLTTRLFGYFPGKRFKKIGDVPRGVMLQWRKWCLNREYSVGAEGPATRAAYAQATFPVVALSISDDELMTLRGTQSLINLYTNAPQKIERITPQDIGVTRIGHFGFFREQFSASLWPRIAVTLSSFKQ